jgi:flagellar motor switch protein FliN/FliY
MQAPEISETVKSIAQKFCDALTETLSGACSSKWQVTLPDEPSEAQPDTANAASFRCVFEGSSTGDALLVFPESVLEKLSLRDVAEDAPDLRVAQMCALLAGLREGLASLAAVLEEAGASSVQVEEVDSLTLTDEQVVELWMQSDTTDPESRVSFQLCLSQKLLAGLKASSAKPFVFPDAEASGGANLDLVMGVELNVTLRFGQRQLALREVLDLTSGSVVELDRQVDEPVELILDGRVVARGEAVIIDGNYGMRITQLMPHPLL